MSIWNTFEEFWENSGILETDAFNAIADECGFTKDNVPQALKSWARTIYGLVGEHEEFKHRLNRNRLWKRFLRLF